MMRIKSYSEFINEGLRIKNNNILLSGFEDIKDYLLDYDTLKEEYDEAASRYSKEDNENPVIASFSFRRHTDGFSLDVMLVYNNIKNLGLYGLYIDEFRPRTLLVYVNLDELYPNGKDVDNHCLDSIMNALEHESTHFLQHTDTKGKMDKGHEYIMTKANEDEISFAEGSMNHFLYQLFNDIEFEAFLASASYKRVIEDIDALKTSHGITMVTLREYERQNGLSFNWGRLENTEDIDSNIEEIKGNSETETDIFGEGGMSEENIRHLFDDAMSELAKHYNKTYEESSATKWANLLIREGSKRYKSFMKKIVKNIYKYCPEVLKDRKL